MSAETRSTIDTTAVAYDVEAHYRELEQTITAANLPTDLGRVRAAFEVAERAHAGQKRKDGTPYISHTISGAIITAEMGLDEDAIVAALLHDCIEDTSLTHEDIAHSFGPAVADIVEGSSMKIVVYPTLPTRPNYPSKRRNTALGMLLGAFLMIAYLAIRELLDTRVRSEQELEEKFGIPIIGTIPNFDSAGSKGGYNYGYRKSQKKGSK